MIITFTREQLQMAYTQAKKFFTLNPDKWTRNAMYVSATGCMCFSGRMAVELGFDPATDRTEFESAGWTISDMARKITRHSIVSVNDSSTSLDKAIKNFDRTIAPKLFAE